MKRIIAELIILAVRPLIHREIPGWGRLFDLAVGGYRRRDWLWAGQKLRRVTGKDHKFQMDLDLSHWGDRYSFFLGRWVDLAMLLVLRRILDEGDVVVDVGAKIGDFALPARHLVGASGAVHAFEPNPASFARLAHHIALNRLANVTAHPCALGSAHGRRVLTIPAANIDEATLAPVGREAADCETVEVDVRVGDRMLGDVVPRLIKIDVEGAELDVLAGLGRLIEASRPALIVECVDSQLQRFGRRAEELWDFAETHGYRVFDLGLTAGGLSQELVLKPAHGPADASGLNILLLHAEDRYLRTLPDA
jgi:FkbM family methyltransferase